MKARLQSRFWKNNQRTDLCKAIPLDTPFHVFVDVSSACNHSCKFCFNHDKTKSFHEIMKPEVFEDVVIGLTKFPRKLKSVKMYGFGEPLLNEHLADMIRIVKMAGVSERVETTSNGWWLKPETSSDLIDAGLDRLVISVNGLSDEQLLDVTGARVNFEEYVKQIQYFYDHRENCILHIKTTDATVGNDPNRFFNIFGDICDEISIDMVAPIWYDVKSDASPTTNLYNNPIKPVEVCPYIFYHMTVHSNGQVSTCFVDWQRMNIIGDATKESLVDIWNGERLKEIRMNHLTSNRCIYPMCCNCGQLVYGQADCIDGGAGEIVGRLG